MLRNVLKVLDQSETSKILGHYILHILQINIFNGEYNKQSFKKKFHYERALQYYWLKNNYKGSK